MNGLRTSIKMTFDTPTEPITVESEMPVALPAVVIYAAVQGMDDGREVYVLSGPLRGFIWEKQSWYCAYVVGDYEQYVQKAWVRLVRKGDTIYDIGCHHGWHGCFAKRLGGPDATVYCFDPVEENIQIAERIAKRNALTNMEFVLAAVGRKTGHETFWFSNGDQTVGRLAEATEGIAVDPKDFHRGEMVVVSLDGLVFDTKFPVPDVLKVDTEGGEYDVLRGAERLIAERHPSWIVSTHSEKLREICKEYLLRHYDADRISEDGEILIVQGVDKETSKG